MMWGNGIMGWSWGFALVALVGIGILIYVVVRLLSKNGSSVPSSTATPTPSELSSARRILDDRFARGDITAEQYREQIRVLGEDR